MLIKKRRTLHTRRRWWAPARLRSRKILIAACLVLCTSIAAFATFFQTFETGTAGWFGATQVPTLTHLIASDTQPFHAEDSSHGAFTRWGAYSKTFPLGGYTTSVDIYLDISAPYGSALAPSFQNDTRFDWTSAISTPSCGHRRDFVFNAGFYTDTDTTGSGPRFVISASNNAGRGGAFPKNPGRDPFTINAEGWYTFEHRFYSVPPGPGGQLYVDLTIRNAAGAPLHTWTLTDPSDIIGTTVGGNRYGWFALDEFPYLAFDTSMLVGFQDYCDAPPPNDTNAKITGGGWIPWLNDKGSFGLTVKTDSAGNPSGNLTYQDHGVIARTVKSTEITSLTLDGNCADFSGTATVNGSGSVAYQIRVCDNGEPGSGSDTFRISMNDGYNAFGTLGGGNIQIH